MDGEWDDFESQYDKDKVKRIDRYLQMRHKEYCNEINRQIAEKEKEIIALRKEAMNIDIKMLHIKADIVTLQRKIHIKIERHRGHAWRQDINSDTIAQFYRMGMSRTKIAKTIGCSYNTVTNRLKDMGIEIRKRKK